MRKKQPIETSPVLMKSLNTLANLETPAKPKKKHEYAPGTIRLGRSSGGDREDIPVHIEIEDSISGVRFLEIHLSVRSIGDLLTTGRAVDCELEFKPKAPIGKKHEHKTILVPSLTNHPALEGLMDWRLKRELLQEASIKPFLVDGWEYAHGFGNFHCGSDDKGYSCVFRRYVEATEEDVQAVWDEREKRAKIYAD
jgi:hypothetical protein